MKEKLQNHRERDRPEPPETPFVCAGCRFGLLMLHKIPVDESEAWNSGKVRWLWVARCNNSRIAGRYPEMFCAPVVDCEGYAARDIAHPQGRPLERGDE